MPFLVSTSGTQSPVVLNDLGGRSLAHPTNDFDLLTEFTATEIADSTDLLNAISAGHLIVTANTPPTNPGDVVTTQGPGNQLPPLDGSLLTGVTGKYRLLLAFGQENGKPYADVSSNSYTTVTQFRFSGTSAQASPGAAKITAEFASLPPPSGATVSARIYDVTNAVIVAEATGIAVATSPGIHALGAVSNLPASEAVFELQVKVSSNGKHCRVSSLSFYEA